ncbi:hypothetical protein GIB67_000295 [Kingdonia uniflora]|uniref:Uncharacterized protein n=1 Tax=Kingdonia uniflora TaxID=39325 RepID=A0A7J7LC75_9MAGN|nr:hypothetical protein GIB67_000295 [Kingdonia uniflora]
MGTNDKATYETSPIKQKVQQDPDMNSEVPVKPQEPKVIRHFPQTRPVADNSSEKRTGLSKDVLAGVFGGSS